VELRRTTVPTEVTHVNIQPSIDLTMGVSGRDLGHISDDVQKAIDEFGQRAQARLQLLPPHDPQFRRNRERVARDAEREHLILEWDLGYDEGE